MEERYGEVEAGASPLEVDEGCTTLPPSGPS
jgi:hypothetical protein